MCVCVSLPPSPMPTYARTHASVPFSITTVQSRQKPNKLLTMTNCSRKHRPGAVQQPSLAPRLGVRRGALTSRTVASQGTARRSGNYHPSIWSHSLITESTRSSYSDKRFLVRLEELKLHVKCLLEPSGQEPLVLLQTIDSLQRLGVAYHFQKEIKNALEYYYENYYHSVDSREEAALNFRLLRQHGYQVSSERMLSDWKDLTRELKDFSSQDIRTLMAIYEASHLAIYGEASLQDVKHESARHLQSMVGQISGNLAKEVGHALEMPFHWMMPRLEARRYIDVYEGQTGRNFILLELARLDFNIVQSLHQGELRELSSWWTGLGLSEKLKFSRDRLVENYLWAVGIAFEPQFSSCRLHLTKLICILTVIDDIYDVYGSLHELELFTAAVESWKLEVIEKLPDYMQPCLLALYSYVNQVSHEISMIHGWDATPFICKEWKRLCKGYLLEAKWFNKEYRPKLIEYLENGWITVGGPLAMVHAYLLQENPIPHDLANCLDLTQALKLIFLSSLITRISDDFGTSNAEMERGDVMKSIECYMEETRESKENSREQIKRINSDLWTELNEECQKTQLSNNFVRIVVNMAKTAQCIFQYGDGIGTSSGITKERIISLFFKDVK